MIAHNVFFSLKENTPAIRAKVLADCQKYLTGHPGVQFLAYGTPSDILRDVTDRDYDIGLHVVFEDRASHDAYLIAPRHQQFVAENKVNWKKVRVFDSEVMSA